MKKLTLEWIQDRLNNMPWELGEDEDEFFKSLPKDMEPHEGMIVMAFWLGYKDGFNESKS